MPNQLTLAQRVSSSFSRLLTVAADLNAVSDELGKCVADIDAALKKLNIGIAVWVNVSRWGGDGAKNDLSYWAEELGFAKINGKWGLSLRRVDGDENRDYEDVEEWLFGDAPRALRLQAIDKIPNLIEQLDKEAVKVISEIQGKMSEVQAVAAALKSSAPTADADLNASVRKLNPLGEFDPQSHSVWQALGRDPARTTSGLVEKPGAKEIFPSRNKGAK